MVKLKNYLPLYPGDDYIKDELFTVVGPRVRRRGYATVRDLVEMGRWKFRGLWPKKHIAELKTNNGQVIRTVTGIALTLRDRQAIELLTVLNGVGVPMASTILTMVFPNKFAVIDVRAWAALYTLGLVRQDKRTFTAADYALYMRIVRRLARKNHISPRQVDMALWAYDRYVPGRLREV